MTLYLSPILHSINMNASAGGLDMLLFNKEDEEAKGHNYGYETLL